MSCEAAVVCSGLMYSRVPTTSPSWVSMVSSVNWFPVALAMPKSMTFGTALPS